MRLWDLGILVVKDDIGLIFSEYGLREWAEFLRGEKVSKIVSPFMLAVLLTTAWGGKYGRSKTRRATEAGVFEPDVNSWKGKGNIIGLVVEEPKKGKW